jgi:hypothetical protein
MALKDIFTMVKADRYTADGCEVLNKAREADVEDRRYNVGEISEKTGLQKTANGWVKPKNGKQPGAKENGPLSPAKRKAERIAKMQKETGKEAPYGRTLKGTLKTPDDNPLTERTQKRAEESKPAAEKTDLEYRKSQLQRLKEEVVDIEEMTSGISIMDLGLNEFRLDLLEYTKNHPSLDKTPFGLHSVAQATEDTPAGVIYVLKNLSNSVNIDNQNRLHPFYMVYIGADGEVICDHLSPKAMLDKMRFICKGKTQAIPELYREFNRETRDGRNMSEYSKLLGDAIASITETKEESDIDSFLSGDNVSFFSNEIKGLDDFELICFLVIK